MPEYECSPIWMESTNGVYSDVTSEQLNLDEDLSVKINSWTKWFDSTLNQDYPPKSGFKSRDEEFQFEAKGVELWKAIQSSLMESYVVIYHSIQFQKIFEKPADFEKVLLKR